MFGQLVVSKTAVLPAFYKLSLGFLQLSTSRPFLGSCRKKTIMQSQFSKVLLVPLGTSPLETIEPRRSLPKLLTGLR